MWLKGEQSRKEHCAHVSDCFTTANAHSHCCCGGTCTECAFTPQPGALPWSCTRHGHGLAPRHHTAVASYLAVASDAIQPVGPTWLHASLQHRAFVGLQP